MRVTTWLSRGLLTGLSVAALLAFGMVAPLPVAADVTPPSVSTSLPPGGSVDVDKSVDVPEVPPVLDLCLVVDNTGSYGDDIGNIKALAPTLFDDVRASVADSNFCLATFRDFPISNWGSPGDWAYRLDQDVTASKVSWVNAVNAMAAGGGADGPEAQYEALMELATGVGNDVPPPGPSVGDVTPGMGASFRANATKVVAITTDASFHNAGDGGGPFPYPGPTGAATVAALNAQNIKVVAIKAPGSGPEMDNLAAATGGSVQSTGSSSAEIADAILAGISALAVDVTAQPVGCGPLSFSFDPPVVEDVVGPAVAEMTESILVADDAEEGSTICCQVNFLADDTVIGTQDVCIDVADVTPPQAACRPGVNPHGKVIPRAGIKSTGINEDGFYMLLASDNLDPDPEIWVTDSLGSGPFGPFHNEDVVKITEDPTAIPESKPIGSDDGNAGAVEAHIILNSDAIALAVDDAGNVGRAICLVPPPPK